MADFEIPSFNQPLPEPQPTEEIADVLFEEDEEEHPGYLGEGINAIQEMLSVVLEPPLPFFLSAPFDVKQGSSGMLRFIFFQ